MKQTFSQLIKTGQDFCIDDKTSTPGGSLTDTTTFIKRQTNATVQFTEKKLQRTFKTKDLPKTMSTVEDQQFYSYPPGLNVIDTVTIDNDTTIPPLRVVDNQAEWDYLNSGPLVGGIPSHIFMRANDFGLYPIPGDAYTLTLKGRYYPRAMSAVDYNTGTVVVAQNSQTITGTNTVWTSAMVGRYFVETDSDGEPTGNFYRIGAFTSTTVMTLETYFEETSLSGATYIIADCPFLPDEIHEFIPYRVASTYYGTKRRDSKKAQEYINFYWTGDWYNNRRTGKIEGGVLGFMQDYAMRGSTNSQILNMVRPIRHDWLSEEWNEVT